MSLNEYGITTVATGDVARFPDEESFYEYLGLPYIVPELRIGLNELDAAQAGALPNLVTEADLKGDLHLHSEWSDGRDPIERMIEAAVEQGYQYMALTDHSSGRGIANGLSNERLVEQIGILRDLQSQYPITILCGSEVDIRADGTLDYPDELLAELDVVVASVHSAMGQDSDTMTQRMIRAMEHPSVTIIGHASTRLLSRRSPVEFDIEALLRAARETGTAMEVNSAPERMDLKDTHAHRARELGRAPGHQHRFAPLHEPGPAPLRCCHCPPRLVRVPKYTKHPAPRPIPRLHPYSQAPSHGNFRQPHRCPCRYQLSQPAGCPVTYKPWHEGTPGGFASEGAGDSATAAADPAAVHSDEAATGVLAETAPDAVIHLRAAVRTGVPWSRALLEAVSLWDAAPGGPPGPYLPVPDRRRGPGLADPGRAALPGDRRLHSRR